jgi:L-lactate dehydrogenase
MTGSKVSVVGAGHVGSAVANALVLLRACDRVVLFDRDEARAEGEAWDIADAIPLLSEMEILPSADYADLSGSEAVVVTVGRRVPPGRAASSSWGPTPASSPPSSVSLIGSARTRS